MRVLIANVTLAGRSGTETVVRDLAFGLRSAGCMPMVYSPRLGEIASEIGRLISRSHSRWLELDQRVETP